MANSTQMWTGRFSKTIDSGVNDFNSSLRFDIRMIAEDIQGSIAHATMLAKIDVLSVEESAIITSELKAILSDYEAGKYTPELITPPAEDVHMAIEEELTKRIGELGKKLHTARSRNDQVALDFKLYISHSIDKIQLEVYKFLVVLVEIANDHTHTIMPGYTHLQRAQPITFAHHMLAYFEMFKRDYELLKSTQKRLKQYCPLGCCALAGTTFPLDRHMSASALGFAEPSRNSLDGVADRDFAVETVNTLSLIMVHLSRFADEIILWSSHEFKFVELDDSFATGSSIMPQKKNPDVAELVRGKSARVFSALQTLLIMQKGIPLAYNKDLQEDKEAVFDAIDTVNLCLPTFKNMLETMQVLSDNMRKAAATGFINATDCADYLTKKGIPFRSAYKITGQIVADCIAKEQTLETYSLADYRLQSDMFTEDIYEAISLETCLNTRNSYGGASPNQVEFQIQVASAWLYEIEITL